VLPLAALTAWQALHQHYQLKQGDHVLVQGGGGSVGSYAVQIAALGGARVTATAAGASADAVVNLGATTVIDYATRFEDQVDAVDVVVDTVGGDTLTRSWSVLRPGGTLLCIAEEPSADDTDVHDAQALYFVVEPNAHQLTELTRLVDLGRLHPAVSRVLPLSKATEAFAPQAAGHALGKVVLQVRSPAS